jgi:hypothetical protein
MTKPFMLGVLFLFSALVAAGFLIYTLANLEKLNIKRTHPRVWVEASLTVLFSILAAYHLLMLV